MTALAAPMWSRYRPFCINVGVGRGAVMYDGPGVFCRFLSPGPTCPAGHPPATGPRASLPVAPMFRTSRTSRRGRGPTLASDPRFKIHLFLRIKNCGELFCFCCFF